MPRLFTLKSLLPSAFVMAGLCVPVMTHASFDTYCTPTLTLGNQHYDACSNLPILDPANDNETNMYLLLLDMGLASVAAPKPDQKIWTAEYGTVPFDFEILREAISNKAPNKRQINKNDKENSYVYEERCQTNQSGIQHFNQQVSNQKLISATEKALLITQRQNIGDACDGKLAFISINQAMSPISRQYASYINGSIAFYNGDYPTAKKIYLALSNVQDEWLKETATYMLVRTAINQTFHTAKDEYGSLVTSKVNASELTDTFLSISNYFKKYPTGQYAASTRGLLRRAYWMAGQQKKLMAELAWQFHNTGSRQYNLEIAHVPQEVSRRIFDNPLFDKNELSDPFFLGVYDLMHMRDSNAKGYKAISWNELSTQKDQFKTQPEFFRYLQACHLYFIQKKPQQALDYLPKELPAKIDSYLQLSQLVLKGRAMETLKQRDDANAYWNSLLAMSSTPYQYGMIELALAVNLQDQGNFAAFFAKNGPIKQANIKSMVIATAANSVLLKQIIDSPDTSQNEKLAATYTLLEKSLRYQNYQLFVDSFNLLPKNAASYQGYESKTESLKEQPKLAEFLWKGHQISKTLTCNNLLDTITTLAKDAKNEMAQLCYGEFARLNNYYYEAGNTQQSNSGKLSTLGLLPEPFKGEQFSRGQVYQDIIKSPTASADLKAYVLYRAVNCYAPGGFNDCGGKDVEKDVRKAWFQQLKQDYPNSSWAQSLAYYW